MIKQVRRANARRSQAHATQNKQNRTAKEQPQNRVTETPSGYGRPPLNRLADRPFPRSRVCSVCFTKFFRTFVRVFDIKLLTTAFLYGKMIGS